MAISSNIAQADTRCCLALALALLRQARTRCRDELIEMMLRRIRRTQAAAKEQLEDLHDRHRDIEENPDQVIETAQEQETDAEFGCRVRKLLSERGGVEALVEQCETVSAWYRDNDLPLLWPIHVCSGCSKCWTICAQAPAGTCSSRSARARSLRLHPLGTGDLYVVGAENFADYRPSSSPGPNARRD